MDLPQPLKAINIYLRIADEYQTRDPIISYFCRLHALQEGMRINKSDKECVNYLSNLMDRLEKMKAQLKGNDAIGNDIVGQAYVESQALKLFVFADSEDRKSNFSKNVIKAFFTASILFDVMKLFGPIFEEIEQQKKYAKWKATYINDCQKKDIVPKPGPPDQDEPGMPNLDPHIQNDTPRSDTHGSSFDSIHPPPTHINNLPSSTQNYHSFDDNKPERPANQPTGQNLASGGGMGNTAKETTNIVPRPDSNLKLSPDMAYIIDPIAFSSAEKLCKFAHSALQYEDITTAITNLQECLQILTKMRRS